MADEKIIATSSEEVTEKADLQTEQADLQPEQAETAEKADLQPEKKETKKNKPCTRWRHKRFK